MLYSDSRETGRSNVLQRSRIRSGCDRVTIGKCSMELFIRTDKEELEGENWNALGSRA